MGAKGDSKLTTSKVNADYVEYCYYRLWIAAGASEGEAKAISRAASFGDRQGKLSQGMGWLEVPYAAYMKGGLNQQSLKSSKMAQDTQLLMAKAHLGPMY